MPIGAERPSSSTKTEGAAYACWPTLAARPSSSTSRSSRPAVAEEAAGEVALRERVAPVGDEDRVVDEVVCAPRLVPYETAIIFAAL